MNEQRLRQMVRALAEELVPDSIDLYPAIRARLEERKRGGRYAPSPVLAQAAFRTLALQMGMAVLAVALLLQVGVATAPPSHQTPVALVTASTPLKPVSFAEAQRQVPFRIHRLTSVPNGLTLAGIFLAPEPRAEGGPGGTQPPSVVLSYRAPGAAPGSASPGLSLQLNAGSPVIPRKAPASLTRIVALKDQTAVYVPGVLQSDGRWDGQADGSTLVWTMPEDNVGCVLTQSGLGLSRGEMVRIANSLQ